MMIRNRFALLVAILIFTLALSVVCRAQEKQPDKKEEAPTRVEVAPDMQQAFMTSNGNVSSATASLEIARLRLEVLLLRLRAFLKVPEDFEARVDDRGRLFFEKPKEEKKADPAPAKP